MYKDNETQVLRFKPVGAPANIHAADIGSRVFTATIDGISGLFLRVGDTIVSLQHAALKWPVEDLTINDYRETLKVREGV